MTLIAFPEHFAAAAVGRAHRRCGRGGQDAHAFARGPGVVAAAVADGCSAGARSEVGAGVGARFAAAAAVRRVTAGIDPADVPALVVADLVEELGRLARALSVDGADLAGVIEEHLLFTMQVALVLGERALVFGVGDGVVSLDGAARVLDQGPAPDYPAYALFPDMPAPRLALHHDGAFTSIAIASDGAAELIAARDLVLADGSALGGLELFERDARFSKNPSLAQKRFHAWCDAGGPVDDCTVAVLRRPA